MLSQKVMMMRYFDQIKSRSVLSALMIMLALSFAANAQKAQAKPDFDAAYYNSIVSKLAKAKDNDARREAIAQELAELKVSHTTETFSTKNRRGDAIKGTNIVAEVPNSKAKKTIMIGAHLDRVDVGTGALDNASGVATVLLLIKQFKNAPLSNVTFKAGFWDKEEVGLVGSRMYVEAHKEKGLPNVYINFDIYGYGDVFWLWAGKEDGEFVKSMKKASDKAKYTLSVTANYPGSDHRSFATVAEVDTYSFSLLTKGEIEAFSKMFAGEKLDPANAPKVMQTIHTDKDQENVIDAPAVVRSLPVIEKAIRDLDKK